MLKNETTHFADDVTLQLISRLEKENAELKNKLEEISNDDIAKQMALRQMYEIADLKQQQNKVAIEKLEEIKQELIICKNLYKSNQNDSFNFYKNFENDLELIFNPTIEKLINRELKGGSDE